MKANTGSYQMDGAPDARQAIAGWLICSAAGIVLVGLILLLAAGRLDWVNAWVYLAICVVVSAASVFFTDAGLW